MIILKTNNKRAFVLLFTIVVSSIILAIALGVTNIAFKEAQFGTSAKDTNESFFAADVGVECALLYDKSTVNRFTNPDPGGNISCAGADISVTPNPSNNDASYSFSFTVPSLGSSGGGCAKVTVSKTNIPSTNITSKGYNLGGAACNSTSASLVEREILVSY